MVKMAADSTRRASAVNDVFCRFPERAEHAFARWEPGRQRVYSRKRVIGQGEWPARRERAGTMARCSLALVEYSPITALALPR